MIIINLNDLDVNNLHYEIIKEEKNGYDVKLSYNINGDLYQDFLIRLTSKKLIKSSSYYTKFSNIEIQKLTQIKNHIKIKLHEIFLNYHTKFFSGELAEFEIKYSDLDREKMYLNDYKFDKDSKNDLKNLGKFCDIIMSLNIDIRTYIMNSEIMDLYDLKKNATNAKVYINFRPKIIKEVNFSKEDFKNNYEIIKVQDSYSTTKILEI